MTTEQILQGRHVITGCIIEGGQYATGEDGSLSLSVAAGGSLEAGHVLLADGAQIRALEDGGFVIELPAEVQVNS